MQHSNVYFGLMNIICGIIFIVISIPLVKKKVPMNRVYGFRLRKAFASEENWYEINWYGGKQLIQWSVVMIIIGLLYLAFPDNNILKILQNPRFPVAPMIICVAIAIVRTILFARKL